jgi:hypothetical protein
MQLFVAIVIENINDICLPEKNNRTMILIIHSNMNLAIANKDIKIYTFNSMSVPLTIIQLFKVHRSQYQKPDYKLQNRNKNRNWLPSQPPGFIPFFFFRDVRVTHLFNFMSWSVFYSFVFVLCLVYNVASVSGLFITDYTFGFLWSLLITQWSCIHFCSF